jgi:thiol:disulfide interchange protein DsbA
MTIKSRAWLLGILLVIATPLWAAGIDEGIEYKTVSPRVDNQIDDKQTEVVELFWYGCPHCFHFEPELLNWLKHKPKNVNFVRIPAVFNPGWRLHAQAFYTAKVLGVLDKIHEPLFNAIHLKGKRMASADELADFFAEHGVKKKDFFAAFNSFAVDADVRRAEDLTQRYGIDGVPSLIVDGKYRTSASLAGSNEKMLEVVNYLIAKEQGK